MTRSFSLKARAAFIYIAATSIIIIGVTPIFVGMLAERFALDLSHQGWVISVEMVGIILGTLLSPSLDRLLGSARLCLLAASVALAFNLITAHTTQLPVLFGSRLLCGVGAGLLYTCAISALGRMPDQDRSYGALLFLQTAVFSAFAAGLPQLVEHVGAATGIYALGGWFLLNALVSRLLPTRVSGSAVSSEPDPVLSHGAGSVGLCALIGMLFLQLSIYSIWGFLDGIAQQAGITATDVGWAFGLGLLGGLPGSALPGLFGRRLKRGAMIFLGSLLVALSVALLADGVRNASDLALAVFLMNFGWTLALTYYMSIIVTHDPQGRLSPLIGVTQVAAAALAPALVAFALPWTGQGVIFMASFAAVAAGGVVQLFAVRIQRRHYQRSDIGRVG